MSAHTAESVLAEFGLTWVNERQLAQACADARNELARCEGTLNKLITDLSPAEKERDALRNALVLDEAKVVAAWAMMEERKCVVEYDGGAAYLEYADKDDLRAALLAAGFTERAT